MSSKVGAANTGANVAGAAVDTVSAAGNTGTDAAAAIVQINAAAEAMNQINLATTFAQLKEAGPKNMKTLTQG